jgi:hypothetical protein
VRRNLVSMRYYETYYYANIVHNVLSEPGEYLRSLIDWHVNSQSRLFSAPFEKWSVLHDFCRFVIRALLDERISRKEADSFARRPNAELQIDQALRFHGFAVDGFRDWLHEQQVDLAGLTEDHIADYHVELSVSGPLEDLLEQLSQEVFFIIFANRLLLANLHDYISGVLSRVSCEDVDEEIAPRFTKAGRLRRCRVPKWAKSAVYFRDRGRCARCLADLTGLVASQNDQNFDHIVPLALGGMNDVTNLQLLCGACNRRKSATPQVPLTRYEAWY